MTMQRITVLGGTGFVGSHLVVQLAKIVPEVIVLTRRPQRFRSLNVLNNVQVQKADVHDRDELVEVLQGSDVVVNLIGILNQTGGNNTFSKAHAELTRQVVIAANDAGVPRYLHMSALHADADNGSSEYLRSKGLAERYLRELAGDLAWTIFQPSVIFGPEDSFFNRFGALVQGLPFFPLACPDAKLAPVYVGDVCQAMCQALNDPDAVGSTVTLCGPKDYTLKELVVFTGQTLGLSRPVIGLPDFAARLQARVMELLPGQPFTRDNYLSLQTDNICSDDCQRQPASIEAVVPTYLGTTGKRARLQASRREARR